VKQLLYIFFILILQTVIVAGNNDKVKPSVKNVSGKITSLTGEEIAGVKITIKETNETFYADLDGNFKFPLKTDKQYSISVESIGYAPLEIKSDALHLYSEINLKELN
jgi:hypothetical protein